MGERRQRPVPQESLERGAVVGGDGGVGVQGEVVDAGGPAARARLVEEDQAGGGRERGPGGLGEERAGAVVVVAAVAVVAVGQAADAAGGAGADRLDLVVGRRRHRHEAGAAGAVVDEDAVGDGDVIMQVGVEGRAEALHRRDGPRLTSWCSSRETRARRIAIAVPLLTADDEPLAGCPSGSSCGTVLFRF